MSDHDLWQSVDRAKYQLSTLRARLQHEGTAPAAPEVWKTLGDLLEMLDKLQFRSGLLREILARTSDAIFAKDRDGRYVMINPQGAVMFGMSVEDILGQDDTALFERESAERTMVTDRMVMDTGRSQTLEESFDIRGVPTTLRMTKAAWYEPRGTLMGLIGSAQDVTERRKAEHAADVQQDRLRSMASEIVIAEERLRQSLAAELHDGIGQDIALTKMKLSALRGSTSAELHDPLGRIEQLVEQADRSLRSMTYRLCPPSLHDLGLVPALEWLAEDFSSRFGLGVRLEDEGAPTVVDDRMRVILFRSVRELLTNIVTHAGTSEASVRLSPVGSMLRILVTDEGAGFDSGEVGLEKHGLFGVREQMRHVGGSMHIDSAPGRGTEVRLTAPLTAGGERSE